VCGGSYLNLLNFKEGNAILTKYDFQPFKFDFLVRRGQLNGDGGYLIPNNTKTDLLISFGLGDNWKFENDLIKYDQANSFIVFDHTQNLSNYIKQVFCRFQPRNFNLYFLMGRIVVLIRYFIDFIILRKKHIKKKISKNGSLFSAQSKFKEINVTEIFQEFVNSENSKIFLKIDIEGSEYEIIEQIMNYHKQIKIIVIEFHDIIRRVEEFEKLLIIIKSKYSLIHTHINNNRAINNDMIPEICEFTFISKVDFQGVIKVDKIPLIGLDYPNHKLRMDPQIDFTDMKMGNV
jgi:hypothetical protein